MGFRSIFIADNGPINLPSWFLEKWGGYFHFYSSDGGKKKGFPISSPFPIKIGQFEDDLYPDLQKLVEDDRPIILIWLHECGGLTRLELYSDRVVSAEPREWESVERPTHSYCGHCDEHPDTERRRAYCHCGGETTQGDICVKCQKPKYVLALA